MQFTFTTREDYLKYKAEWKAAYFQTVKDIRASALARRAGERAFSKAGPYQDSWRHGDAALAVFRTAAGVQERARSTHRQLKSQATELLAERARSKVEAGRQRALRLREVAA